MCVFVFVRICVCLCVLCVCHVHVCLFAQMHHLTRVYVCVYMCVYKIARVTWLTVLLSCHNKAETAGG